MRAKLQVMSVTPNKDGEGNVQSEDVKFLAVCGTDPFGPNGESEDNTFAKWSPTASMEIRICNPALFGAHVVGEKYYVDFTKADAAPVPAEA